MRRRTRLVGQDERAAGTEVGVGLIERGLVLGGEEVEHGRKVRRHFYDALLNVADAVIGCARVIGVSSDEQNVAGVIGGGVVGWHSGGREARNAGGDRLGV